MLRVLGTAYPYAAQHVSLGPDDVDAGDAAAAAEATGTPWEAGTRPLADAVAGAAVRWFGAEVEYPASWDPAAATSSPPPCARPT
ncbi:MAG: hypothetical protein HOQ22_17490 [Nocardioidaceae bacterium]|nr:hypothetical protein [Nocardioidaceae bacterium]NUS52818.1 hypothetical protein [Nocardioidaceae bacterium]